MTEPNWDELVDEAVNAALNAEDSHEWRGKMISDAKTRRDNSRAALRSAISAVEQELKEAKNRTEYCFYDKYTSGIPCQECGCNCVEFTIPNNLWNKVMRPDGHEGEKEYICFSCWNKKLIDWLSAVEQERDNWERKSKNNGLAAAIAAERMTELEAELKEAEQDAKRLAKKSTLVTGEYERTCIHCGAIQHDFESECNHKPDCPITLHRARVGAK